MKQAKASQTTSPEVSQEINTKTSIFPSGCWGYLLFSFIPMSLLLLCLLVETFLRGCRKQGPALGNWWGMAHTTQGSWSWELEPRLRPVRGLELRTDLEPVTLSLLVRGPAGAGRGDGCQVPGQVTDPLKWYLLLNIMPSACQRWAQTPHTVSLHEASGLVVKMVPTKICVLHMMCSRGDAEKQSVRGPEMTSVLWTENWQAKVCGLMCLL